MAFTSHRVRLCALLVFCSCLAGSAVAGTIVARPPDPLIGTPGYEPTEWAIVPEQQLAVSWSQSAGSTDTVVSVFGIENHQATAFDVTFHLLFGSLDGPDVALAETRTVDPNSVLDFPLWVGGLTLDPGTYFLTASTGGNLDWLAGDFANQTSDPLASILADYNSTGSSWSEPQVLGMAYRVDGTLGTPGGGGADAPEPGTFALFGAGMVVLAAAVRRRGRKGA